LKLLIIQNTHGTRRVAPATCQAPLDMIGTVEAPATEGYTGGAAMNRYLKFGIPVAAALLGIFLWLGLDTSTQAPAYFVKIPELKRMDAHGRAGHLRVVGFVKEGSIAPAGKAKAFLLVEHKGKGDAGEQLKVICFDNHVPDTFLDGAEALVDGQLGADGVFRADKLMAKSAEW
jgi:cytochrome c-type biogenesis protein CcmE